MLDSYDTTPGQRFRLEQWEPFLKEKGIDVDYFSYTDESLRKILYKPGQVLKKTAGIARATLRRIGHVRHARNYDVVYLFRTASLIGPAVFERLVAKSGKPMVFDFDDAIYLTDTSAANRKFGWLKFSGKTADICRLSSAVTVGNSHLANFAKRYNDNVFVVPTSIDTCKYKEIDYERKRETPVVGWTGSSTSQYHLEQFEPVLLDIHRNLDIEFRVISDREPDFKEMPYVWVPWSAEQEVAITSELDIGIMPIPDEEWSRGKCAAKALQYMALGIPAVCSNVGANKDVIEHGVNGFLAESSDEWLNYVGQLVQDRELRIGFGRKARKTVVEDYSMKKCADLFDRVVRFVMSQSEANKA